MRYSYLVGTIEELKQMDGIEFTSLSDARRYAEDNDLSILELQWEYTDSEQIK